MSFIIIVLIAIILYSLLKSSRILDTFESFEDEENPIVVSSSTENIARLIKLIKKPTQCKEDTTPKCNTKITETKEEEYKNWALDKDSKISQSSTFDNFKAENAIDGKFDTYSQTDMPANGTSWLSLILPSPIEISKIVIHNRADVPGSFSNRERLPPFSVIIKNSAGATVDTKKFTDILSEYVWDDVYMVGTEVRIEQEKQNYLHIAEIEVFGVKGNKCEFYEEQMSIKSLNVSSIFKKLKDSACLILSAPPNDADIKLKAKQFDNILSATNAVQQVKHEEAKKLKVVIDRQQEIEKEVAARARRLGLPPPPEKFNQEQIDLVTKHLTPQVKILTDEQKAECLKLYNTSASIKAQIEEMAPKIDKDPSMATIAQQLATKYNTVWNSYQSTCK